MNHEVILGAVHRMKHARIRNYIAPGLSSWLVGGEGNGKVRLFTSDRDTHELITPHSHRFAFTCIVLKGKVTNVIYTATGRADQGNAYALGTLKAPSGGMGQYEFVPGDKAVYYSERGYEYEGGQTYGLRHNEIHSIRFSRDCAVLFFEGPEQVDESTVLEPWSDGRRVPTFVTQPWMFERDAPPQPAKHE